MQNLVPALHDFAVLSYDRLQPFVEIGLEIARILETVSAHKSLDVRIAGPLLSVYLVAADVKILIGKKPRHFANEIIQKLVRVLARWVHGRIMNAEMPRNLIRARPAGQLRIGDEPARGVPGHIEFRHHANAAIARVLDYFLDLVLGVKLPLGRELLQPRKLPALHPEPLIVRKVPVQYVELHRLHAIQLALDYLHGHKVAGNIDQQSVPGEARAVFNQHRWSGKTFRADFDQLQKGLQPMQDAQRRRSIQMDFIGRYLQPV